jgi:hypothetical protein
VDSSLGFLCESSRQSRCCSHVTGSHNQSDAQSVAVYELCCPEEDCTLGSLVCGEFEALGNLYVLAGCLRATEDIRTSKHGYTVDVVEFAIAFFVERSPNVGNQDLRSLHDANRTFLKHRLITKAWEMVSKEVDKFTGTVVGGFNKASNASKLLVKLVGCRLHSMVHTNLFKYPTRFAEAVDSFLQQWYLFFSRGTEDICQLLVWTF